MNLKELFRRRKKEETKVEYFQGENHTVVIVRHHPNGESTRIIAHTVPPGSVGTK